MERRMNRGFALGMLKGVALAAVIGCGAMAMAQTEAPANKTTVPDAQVEANVLKATVIKEVNATFSPEPGVDRWRPAQATPIDNLFLAGDWTQTGWPSTMEGAVRSGYLAAEAALTHFGQPTELLQPDLPVEGLCKYWARRSASGTN